MNLLYNNDECNLDNLTINIIPQIIQNLELKKAFDPMEICLKTSYE